MIKEACVENFMEALQAEKQGASRVELCENLAVGGTTPSYGTIRLCKEKLRIPLFAMIRPRGGNFVYNSEELEIMKTDIQICKELGVNGIVFGILTPDNHIDVKQTKEFVRLAAPMQVTFHKAIDEVEDPILATELLKTTGVHRILSSGKAATALEGQEILNQMIDRSGEELTIVVAGKVMKENLATVQAHIPSREFHGKLIVGSLTGDAK